MLLPNMAVKRRAPYLYVRRLVALHTKQALAACRLWRRMIPPRNKSRKAQEFPMLATPPWPSIVVFPVKIAS